MIHRSTFAFALATAVTLTGCSLHLNKSAGLVGTTLPALDPDAQSYVSDQPSVTAGHDRSHWQRTAITLPLRQVEHHPSYTHEFLLAPTTHRAAGLFPTIDTALQVDERVFDRTLESPINIAGAGALIVWAPIDMIINGRWPLTVERGSGTEHQRMNVIADPDQFQRWIEVDHDNAEQNGHQP